MDCIVKPSGNANLQPSHLAVGHPNARRRVPWHCSGTAAELHALGSATASVRLTPPGTPSGTFPVRTRHAQPVLALISSPRDLQQSCVGADPPPLVLLVRKLRHGVKLVIRDAVHDAVPPCPDAGAVSSAAATTAAATMIRFSGPMDDLLLAELTHRADAQHDSIDRTRRGKDGLHEEGKIKLGDVLL